MSDLREIGTARERGAALLTVLLLVAVIAILAAHGIDRLAGATKLASNARELSQAKAYLIAAESIGIRSAEQIVSLSPGRTINLDGWNGKQQSFPVPGGIITASLSDGGNCFNINSLVTQQQEILTARPEGLAQFSRLMVMLGILDGDAADIAESVADWIDSDLVAAPRGAEDQYYLQQETPYRTANALIVDVSELRTIKGVTDDIYVRIAPWLCALPTTDLSPININTLRPEQAILLAMLGEMPSDLTPARQFLGRRPELGYASLNDFWAQSYPVSLVASSEVQSQVKLTTRWFRVELAVEMQSALVEERALIDAARRPARLVHRQRSDAF
ncbi:type II secretion system minor pseudopilin GspK [Sphingorhabdus sp. SMR4y]|uniref:type II secretion system minor pseudopilin GspK n=1 Tax=Sphingorhabdus sp. SMR4y TaxID=2584094 RepID=UPI000B602308|nr:type II secretion system minor pseudopilin GspK [Sphingorhabdus sp. SMR4y]ASK88046.1 putative type II secretion system protein K [Sphingorhabdus sp. SMR4y]